MGNSKIDPIIHAPNRLQICALLSPIQQMEFRVIKEELGVSDSVLSKHIKQLEDVDYIKQRKNMVNGRARRWYHLTAKGRKAFDSHLAELKRILSDLN
jgi:DNA-binding MarR family transcriptional regulator